MRKSAFALALAYIGQVAVAVRLQPQLPLVREATFAGGLSRVYGKLKLNQATDALRQETGEIRAKRWARVHDGVGSDLYELCSSLGGAYVKVGQFFSTRPDLVPEEWCRHLGMLCDAVEPMNSTAACNIALQEVLNVTDGKQTLTAWRDQPLGSASVAQVHAARLIPNRKPSRWKRLLLRGNRGRMVAVKVQRPEAAIFFARDFRAITKAAGLVQSLELSFDLLSCLEDLRDRVDQELDFRIEYDHLARSRGFVRKKSRGAIAAPAPILGTRECIISELLDAVPVSALARQRRDSPEEVDRLNKPGGEGVSVTLPGGVGGLLARRAISRTMSSLFDLYGYMVLCTPRFHADPHPGNLLVPRRFRRKFGLTLARDVVPQPLRLILPFAPASLHLIDWGQCGGPTTVLRRKQLARLFIELADAGDVEFEKAPAAASRVAAAMRDLGVVQTGADDKMQAKTARGMFDSVGEIDLEETDLNDVGIEEFPKDLFLVLRVTQILRGLGSSAEAAGAPPRRSLAEAWRPYAKRALAAKPEKQVASMAK